MNFDEVLNKRVSGRKFDLKNVEDSILEEITNAAKKAPIGRNQYKNYRITVITRRDFIKAIEGEFEEKFSAKNALYNAPVFIVVSCDSKVESTIKYEDTACIIENMHLKATDLGLSSCYIRGLVHSLGKDGEYIKLLKLDEGYIPVSGLVLGYPDSKNEVAKKHEIKINYIK
ncbi:MAG: nitroreductase family protein [Peptoniphilaceae bacterium]|nr:nitroreductase family protein [Peptoniphilaceae bacterium]MDD7383234.1 nitroreductase family protein [Peptoniphilaceae bacterium]MDY3737620.1 nitroreductase family protein [Peptoniphilaceae bacterium]